MKFPLPDPSKLPAANRVAFETEGWGDMAKHTAALGAAFVPLTEVWKAFYTQGVLPARTKQIIINRTSYHCDCAYELSGEKQAAHDAGLVGDQYQAIFEPVPSPLFSDAENVAAMIVDELVHKVKANHVLVNRALELMGPDQVRETILVIGMYMFYGRFIASLGIER